MTSGQSDKNEFKSLLLEDERRITDDTVLMHGKSAEHTKEYLGVLDFLETKGSRRQNYRHYATREKINSILSSKAIYLTNGSERNDKYDRGRFNPMFFPLKRFVICMSATTSENTLQRNRQKWAMINFDKKTLKNAMSLKQYECGHFDKNGQLVCVELLDAKKITFRLVDILCFSRKEGNTESFKVGRTGDHKHRAPDGLQQIVRHKP